MAAPTDAGRSVEPELGIPKAYVFMSLAAVAVGVFVAVGGPGALQLGQADSEIVIVPGRSGDPTSPGRTLEIITLLPQDGIPAILNPQFILPEEADSYEEDEPVLG
ncbi:MAG: hypothetical protein O3C10_13740, partial [Chloroflexi bacterium]|nr:hypothetical protein [Chloroflexota bacterium]